MSKAAPRLLLATSNAGKLRELRALLAETGVEVLSQADFGVPDADETGLSFVENAVLKARHAALLTGLPCLADDSGLVVDALRGEPGIYSARYADADLSADAGVSRDQANINKLLRELAPSAEPKPWTARFVCVLALVRHAQDPLPIICQATWEGEVSDQAAGTNGFGYDPIFWLPELACTSAQLPAEQKKQLSHRGQALHQLLTRWAETGL
jgi:XTP/dITP diphosphohydrolase